MFSKRLTILGAAVVAAGVAAAPASAAPVVTQATGANAAAIQGAVDAYRNSLGANNGGNPAAANGRREINWDGVPDDRSAPSFMPEGQFRARGALFTTPGLGVQVSGDDDNDGGNPDADPDQVEFTNLNATYATAFAPFSPERLFAPVGSNVTDVEFVVPGSDTPAETNGLGVVFTDVDQAGPTKVELLDADGSSLGTFPVPATAGDESLSFLGIALDPNVRAASARITTGSAALGNPDITQGGSADVVAMDDFIYGEPQPVPAKQADPPDTAGPQVTISGVAKKVGLDALRKGLKVGVKTDEPAAIDARLTAKARNVELARRASATVLLAEKSLGLGSGDRQLKLKPARAALRGADRVRAQLRIVAADASGNRTTVTRTVKAY
jgi:hypothetical protein